MPAGDFKFCLLIAHVNKMKLNFAFSTRWRVRQATYDQLGIRTVWSFFTLWVAKLLHADSDGSDQPADLAPRL